MRPIPVVFHIGALQVHTYGIGLALTFWFAYRYFARRLRQGGYPDRWLSTTFVWVVAAAIVGARLVHVAAHLGYYGAHPIEILAVWHGGLSSFGGLLLGVPAGFLGARRHCPALRPVAAADLVAPVLVAAWAVGRLLGPQLMIAGGGKPTHQWFGMYYAGEVGRRLPVPVFQALECAAIFAILLAVERAWRRGAGRPAGLVASLAVALWGISRFVDEYFWLGHDNGTDGVEIVGLAMCAVGLALVGTLLLRSRRRLGRAGGTARALPLAAASDDPSIQAPSAAR